MLIENFNRAIDVWIRELERYDFQQLCSKPSKNGWSLGQMYLHLIEDTSYYIDQIKKCASSDENRKAKASPDGEVMLQHNEFPDAIIEGAPANDSIPQPGSKESLIRLLTHVKDEMNAAAALMSTTKHRGKTKHPGLGYFGANDWLQFADMHFRHHLRQKKRIDDYLMANQYKR